MKKRVLICASPDLNYIDGSSIWAQTIALATAATGAAKVELLARSAPIRDELYAPLKADVDIAILDGSKRDYWAGKDFTRISPVMMGELAIRLDNAEPYDVIIVRGLEVATKLLEAPAVLAKCWMYLTDIPQSESEYDSEQRKLLQRIAQGCLRVLCQSQSFIDLWRAVVPALDLAKVQLYSPVIPDLPKDLPPIAARPERAIYAGKFKGDWMTLEMARAWPSVRREAPNAELVMIGDKIHNEPDRPEYSAWMKHALKTTPGLIWLGAKSREQVQDELLRARVGLSWRHESMNDTVEYSTKILEYGGAGCAAILNRNSLHEQLLGRDYPLFANSEEEFQLQLRRALKEPDVARQAAEALGRLAKLHTFSARVAEIEQWLQDAPNARGKTKVLVAGHDLKFFTALQKNLEATGQFEFLVDQWRGHNKHDEAKSLALLKQADVIFCEWCLGNLKWYSHNKRCQQRLVARFHAQEARSPYMGEANWENIDHVSFVSEHARRLALRTFAGFPASRTSVIPNYLDQTKFTHRKKTGEARYTLGILGFAPRSKRLDRAVDLLAVLLEHDERYCLRVKGNHPLDYDWLLKREDELAYYREVFERINSDPKLRHKVIFDPPGDDVDNWFTMIGFILSASDHESFHMAVGEGILTGCMPIIWDWEGAVEVWGEKYVVQSLEEAKRAVLCAEPPMEPAAELMRIMSPQGVRQQWQNIIQKN